jgi:hypothetical protein
MYKYKSPSSPLYDRCHKHRFLFCHPNYKNKARREAPGQMWVSEGITRAFPSVPSCP